MLKRLRIRFICINMTIVTVMLCIIFGLVLSFTGDSLERESIRMMQTIGAGPMKLPRPGELQDAVRLPYFSLQVGPRGELLASGGGDFDLSDETFLREIASASFASQEQIGVLEEYGLRFYKVTGPGPQGLVFADMSSEQATMRNLVQTCLFIGAVSLVGFFVISLFLARWAVKPVDEAWAQQRQFVADASHELKTPLTVILTNAELMQEPDCDSVRRSMCTDSILVMSRQMRGLVESLLELARVDNGNLQTVMTPLDYSALVSDSVLPFEPLAFERGMGLQCQIAPGLAVRGSEHHLQQVLDILLDNGLKYASPQAEIRVSLRKQGSHCLLAVENQGAPIAEEDLKNIFKRFYRVDKARTVNGSYGLGLSIAQRIVEEHKGRIWAESKNGINAFFVLLPGLPNRKESEV